MNRSTFLQPTVGDDEQMSWIRMKINHSNKRRIYISQIIQRLFLDYRHPWNCDRLRLLK
jgi:hypothetical protein